MEDFIDLVHACRERLLDGAETGIRYERRFGKIEKHPEGEPVASLYGPSGSRVDFYHFYRDRDQEIMLPNAEETMFGVILADALQEGERAHIADGMTASAPGGSNRIYTSRPAEISELLERLGCTFDVQPQKRPFVEREAAENAGQELKPKRFMIVASAPNPAE